MTNTSAPINATGMTRHSASRLLRLRVMAETLAVCRLDPLEAIPGWASNSAWFSITRTPHELSIVCAQQAVPPATRCERDWRGVEVAGPLDFALTGILAALTQPLADAGISVFALSTYDTDYLLVRSTDLEDALSVLTRAGHTVQRDAAC